MRIFQVDAFSDRPFSGNPAAVCLPDVPLSDRLMQDIAMEMNLSETAFLFAQNDGYALRWFTPETEVDLCGHATLAAAFVLYEEGLLAPDARASFFTRGGGLYARRAGDMIELDFPSEAPWDAPAPDGLEAALGARIARFSKNDRYALAELEDERAVRGLKPDFAGLLEIRSSPGFIATAAGDEYDFVSRFFAPALGVPEDPVTGSAHCALAPYWARRLGKDTLRAYQASKRGGELELRLDGGRVHIGGRAAPVFAARLEL